MVKLALILVLISLAFPKVDDGVNSEHIAKYSQFVENHHDNIDNNHEQHAHVHKHSEDGEEHEHDHEHKMNFHTEVKTTHSTNIQYPKVSEIEQSVCFVENSPISDPHPDSIFRPPIS